MSWDLHHPFTLEVVPQPQDIDGLDHTNSGASVSAGRIPSTWA
ncbi:MAG TPA: hypothetical protein VLA61_25855 [Ideonella sp.]|nr:hypothetical protein [Ideonella sp.]HSI51709.1 hypothetical protein [Ideonella sp.]